MRLAEFHEEDDVHGAQHASFDTVIQEQRHRGGSDCQKPVDHALKGIKGSKRQGCEHAERI
jgi:hypothetical protein